MNAIPNRPAATASDSTFIDDDSWHASAACLGVDPDLFFPERGANNSQAKRTCFACPVQLQCLEYAIVRGEKHGIWGGLSERDRRKLRNRIAKAPALRTQYIAEAIGRFDPEGGDVFTLEAYR